MKHIKMLGFAVMAMAALLAFAGSASAAPALTSPAGTEYTGELNATAESSLLLKAGFANITCTASTVAGKVETNDEKLASGKIATLSFSNCGSTTVDTLATGSLQITTTGKGENKGTVTGSGSEVTVAQFGVSCVYGTKTGTTLGTATGSASSTSNATLKFEASLPLISGGFGCANPAVWTGSYTLTKPVPLFID